MLRPHKRHILHAPLPNLRPLRQILHTLSRFQPPYVLLRVKVHPDGILAKRFTAHELIGCLHRGEIVELRLQHVAVRVVVVEGGGGAVVRAPYGKDVVSFALAVREEEGFHGGEGEGDVLFGNGV